MHNIYAIRDAKAGTYSPPFIQLNKATAMRVLSEMVDAKQSLIAKFPADYALFELGTWDETTGKYEAHLQQLHIIDAIQLVSDGQS